MNLLLLILAFLFPHVEGTEGADDTQDDAADDADAAAGDDDGSESDDADTDVAAADDATDDPAPTRASARTDTSADDAREARRLAQEAREAVERLSAKPTTDRQFEEEENKLRDPNTTELEKWQIQSNRTLRQTQHAAQQAMFQAADMSDKAAYSAKAVSNQLYDKYRDKVEAQLSKARQQGFNPPREQVLAVLIGQDMIAGNYKAKAAGAGKTSTVPRGKSPGARSDTPARGSMTAHQKREARLANQNI